MSHYQLPEGRRALGAHGLFGLSVALTIGCADHASVPPKLEGPDGPVSLVDLEVETRRLHDVVADAPAPFVGVDAVAAFERALGPLEREAVLLLCSDGYRPSVRVEDLRRARPLLSFDRTDGDFVSKGDLELGPFYLAWPEESEVSNSAFAYKVEGVDWAPTRPAYLESSEKGAQAFERHCSACHAMDGWGGRVGPELQAPRPIASWVDPRWLKQWILQPRTMREGTSMPGLPEGLPEREAVADAIVAFLEARAAEASK